MRRQILLLFILIFSMTYRASTQDRSYGRSVVMTDKGIVATSHYPLRRQVHRRWPAAAQPWMPLSQQMPCWV